MLQAAVKADEQFSAEQVVAMAEGLAHPKTGAHQSLPALSDETLRYLSTLTNIASRNADLTAAIRAPPKVAYTVGADVWVCCGCVRKVF